MNPIEIKFSDNSIKIEIKKPISDDINIKIDTDGNIMVIPKEETSNISRECESENVKKDNKEKFDESVFDFDFDLD